MPTRRNAAGHPCPTTPEHRTLSGNRHALRTHIAQTVQRHAAWLAPDGNAETLIRLTRHSVTVTPYPATTTKKPPEKAGPGGRSSNK